MHRVQMWQGKVVQGNGVWPRFCPLRQKGGIVSPDWVETRKPTHCSLNELQGQCGGSLLCVNQCRCCRSDCRCSSSALHWPLQMPGRWTASLNRSCNWVKIAMIALLFSPLEWNWDITSDIIKMFDFTSVKLILPVNYRMGSLKICKVDCACRFFSNS